MTEKTKKFGNVVKNILLWSLCIFLVIAALIYMPSVGSIFLLIAAVLVAPINKWQNLLSSVFKKGAFKALVVTIISILGIGLSGDINSETPNIDADISDSGVTIIEQTTTTTAPVTEEVIVTSEADPTLPDDSYFEIHFIDVGQADAALVICDDEAMLIDGGNIADSSLIYSYLKSHNISHLKYVVATHAHEDHIGGLAGALNYSDADVVLSPVLNYDSEAFENLKKYADENSSGITIPEIGDTLSLGSAEFIILSLNTSDNENDTSIVLKLSYGQTSFLFAADAQTDTEQAILSSDYDIKSTLLKVGHHGGDSSSSLEFLNAVMPEYAVISVGKDNSYGHPSDIVLSRLDDADVKVYRTDLDGTIICYSDGKELSFKTNTASTPVETTSTTPTSITTTSHPTTTTTTETTTTPEITTTTTSETPTTTTIQSTTQTTTANNERHYVLNTSSNKFHYPSCSSVETIATHNKDEFTGTREYLISIGYSPCGRCKP